MPPQGKRSQESKVSEVSSSSDIDAIFGKIKERKRKRKKEEEKQHIRKKSKELDCVQKASRKILDGLPIYTEEELNIGKGGLTELCPFDCTCCF